MATERELAYYGETFDLLGRALYFRRRCFPWGQHFLEARVRRFYGFAFWSEASLHMSFGRLVSYVHVWRVRLVFCSDGKSWSSRRQHYQQADREAWLRKVA